MATLYNLEGKSSPLEHDVVATFQKKVPDLLSGFYSMLNLQPISIKFYCQSVFSFNDDSEHDKLLGKLIHNIPIMQWITDSNQSTLKADPILW